MAVRLIVACLAVLWSWPLPGARAAGQADDPIAPGDVAEMVRQVFIPDPVSRQQFLMILQGRGKVDVAPGLIQVLRFVRDDGWIDRTLAALTDEERGKSWQEWILWQQAHSEVEPFEGFEAFKADVMAVIDPSFRKLLRPGAEREVRLEEILWAGARRDGIPALVEPAFVAAAEATYLGDDELVFGVEIEGDARAYPQRLLDWHEVVNDEVGGVPVVLAYDPLAGSGVLYDARPSRHDGPLEFGTSGLLYRSSKLMYDHATESLWQQFSGRPLYGQLSGSEIALQPLPLTLTTWGAWRAAHPGTRVLSLETGHERDYATPGEPYGEYYASDAPMYPVLVPDQRLPAKAFVYGLRVDGEARAWALADFAGGRVINGEVGGTAVVLIGDEATRTVRAYRSEGRTFEAGAEPGTVVSGGESWRIEEAALVGPGEERLERLPGQLAYWFAWQAFVEGAPLAEPAANH